MREIKLAHETFLQFLKNKRTCIIDEHLRLKQFDRVMLKSDDDDVLPLVATIKSINVITISLSDLSSAINLKSVTAPSQTYNLNDRGRSALAFWLGYHGEDHMWRALREDSLKFNGRWRHNTFDMKGTTPRNNGIRRINKFTRIAGLFEFFEIERAEDDEIRMHEYEKAEQAS